MATKKYEAKTKPTAVSVDEFLAASGREEDSRKVVALMKKITKQEPKMWGTSIVGFGSYHYVYETGHSGDTCLLGFSPRKTALTIYAMPGFPEYDALMAKLGKYKQGKSCIYAAKLANLDLKVLEQLLRLSAAHTKAKYPG